jgi:hypothetical protein
MLLGPTSLLPEVELAEGVGAIGIVMVGEGVAGAAVGAGDEAATARSVRRQATIASATTTTVSAINSACARDRFTGRSPQGSRLVTVPW